MEKIEEHKDVIGVGPFIGDFSSEILSFRPYVTWLYNNLSFRKFYVSSYSDRKFLYHWIPDNKFIPVNEKFNNEELQDSHYNNAVSYNSYFKLIRELKNKIYNNAIDIKKTEIKIFTIPYTKLCDPVTYEKKIYTPISVDIDLGDYILFEDKVYFNEYNYKILSEIPSYEDKIKSLVGAKCVVCSAGIWTIIANMQKKPVFSWSEGAIGKYKPNGDYGFRNKNMIIYCDNDTTLKKTMKIYLQKIMEN
jgi:hypothetical protein